MYEPLTGKPYEQATVPELRGHARGYADGTSSRRWRRGLRQLRKHDLVVALYEADSRYCDTPDERQGARDALAAYLATRTEK